MSITITIISNISDYCVSITQCYMPLIFYAYDGVSTKAPTIVSPAPPLTSFQQTCCFTTFYQTSFALI